MTLFQPRSRITANKPRLLPKCFISCDSLVPASRAIVTVLVFSYPLCANRRFAAMRIRSWDEIGGMDLTLFVSGIEKTSQRNPTTWQKLWQPSSIRQGNRTGQTTGQLQLRVSQIITRNARVRIAVNDYRNWRARLRALLCKKP